MSVDVATVQKLVELDVFSMLLRRDGLTLEGLVIVHELLVAEVASERSPVVAGKRERVLAEVIEALAVRTALPRSYWTERTAVEVPDDLGGLL